MSSNSISIVDREIARGSIEGVNFGPKLWVVARSPTAVLVWVYGQSYWSGGHVNYAEPHLTLLPDRSPGFMGHPTYKNFSVPGNRLKSQQIPTDAMLQIGAALDLGMGDGRHLVDAIDTKRTLILGGGGNALVGLGEHWKDAKARGAGFIMLPDGMTEWDSCRGKLGWHPREAKT